MIEAREIDPQDHRALFRQIVEDRRAGRISADYPAWFHLMARLLRADFDGSASKKRSAITIIRFGRMRVRVEVLILSRHYGWEAEVSVVAPKGLIRPPEPPKPSVHFDRAIQDTLVEEWNSYFKLMTFGDGELAAFGKWRNVESICREIYGDCEQLGKATEVSEFTGVEAECIRVQSSIHWRSGRG